MENYVYLVNPKVIQVQRKGIDTDQFKVHYAKQKREIIEEIQPELDEVHFIYEKLVDVINDETLLTYKQYMIFTRDKKINVVNLLRHLLTLYNINKSALNKIVERYLYLRQFLSSLQKLPDDVHVIKFGLTTQEDPWRRINCYKVDTAIIYQVNDCRDIENKVFETLKKQFNIYYINKRRFKYAQNSKDFIAINGNEYIVTSDPYKLEAMILNIYEKAAGSTWLLEHLRS